MMGLHEDGQLSVKNLTGWSSNMGAHSVAEEDLTGLCLTCSRPAPASSILKMSEANVPLGARRERR